MMSMILLEGGGSREDVDSFDVEVSCFVEACQGHIVKTNVFC